MLFLWFKLEKTEADKMQKIVWRQFQEMHTSQYILLYFQQQSKITDASWNTVKVTTFCKCKLIKFGMQPMWRHKYAVQFIIYGGL